MLCSNKNPPRKLITWRDLFMGPRNVGLDLFNQWRRCENYKQRDTWRDSQRKNFSRFSRSWVKRSCIVPSFKWGSDLYSWILVGFSDWAHPLDNWSVLSSFTFFYHHESCVLDFTLWGLKQREERNKNIEEKKKEKCF